MSKCVPATSCCRTPREKQPIDERPGVVRNMNSNTDPPISARIGRGRERQPNASRCLFALDRVRVGSGASSNSVKTCCRGCRIWDTQRPATTWAWEPRLPNSDQSVRRCRFRSLTCTDSSSMIAQYLCRAGSRQHYWQHFPAVGRSHAQIRMGRIDGRGSTTVRAPR